MKPHKHQEIIIAYANGAQVQVRDQGAQIWVDAKNPVFRDDHQYRVKPAEPERADYPKSQLSRQEIIDIVRQTPGDYRNAYEAICNAALRHACDNGQIVTREEFDRAVGDRAKRDMAVARAVNNVWRSGGLPDSLLEDIIKGVTQ